MRPTVFAFDSACSEWQFGEQDRPVSVSIDKVDGAAEGYRVFINMEPPQVHDIVQQVIDYHGFYDLILAWHPAILKACPNAQLFLPWAPWEKPIPNPKKTFSASFFTTTKNWCLGHIFRQEVFNKLPSTAAGGTLPIFKHRPPPTMYGEARTTLYETRQFHVAIENTCWDNYFTEKVMDCFLTKTVPLYWGCPNFGNFFSMDGVLTFNTYDELLALLNSLTPDSYQTFSKAIEYNYVQALQYLDHTGRINTAIRAKLELL